MVSILVVLSYIFNLIAEKVKIPSVILLLSTGVGLNYLGQEFNYHFPEPKMLLELLGIVGLIFIVLEGSLDLKITKQKFSLIGKSLLAASIILLVTSGIICYILIEFLFIPFQSAIAYSVPLGVISSAIAIPSVHKLSKEKKEFIVYESTFSDIIGIMLFNYILLDNFSGMDSVQMVILDLVLIVAISVASSIALLFLLNYTRTHIKFYLIFSILLLLYTFSKMLHLPSLLLILIFGLMLNNASLYIKGKLATYIHIERLNVITDELKLITAETAFIVRTFFFLLFGYSINLWLLNDLDVLIVGSIIIATILLTRLVFLRFISKVNLFPEIFIAPRGLITIVLFYSIPAKYQSPLFNEGILFFVIIVSSLMMMLGLMTTKTKFNTDLESI